MKSERRHELKENSLAGFLENVPYYARVHGNKLLTGLIVILLIAAFVRWRSARAVEKQNLISSNLADARTKIGELSSPNFAIGLLTGDPRTISAQRQTLTADANNAIDTIAGETEDQTIRAEALLAKADLNWTLANLPEIPAATTQPALKSTTSPDEFLRKATDFYTNVLSSYADQPMAVVAARFGLAACAENRRDVATAADQYNLIIKSDTLTMYKTMAEQRLKVLDSIKEPLFLGTLKPEPTTQAAMPTPLTGPSTGPSTGRSTDESTTPSTIPSIPPSSGVSTMPSADESRPPTTSPAVMSPMATSPDTLSPATTQLAPPAAMETSKPATQP